MGKAHTSMFGCCTSTVLVVLVFLVNKIILICLCIYPWFLTLEGGSVMLSQNVGKEILLLAANSPEERNSQDISFSEN